MLHLKKANNTFVSLLRKQRIGIRQNHKAICHFIHGQVQIIKNPSLAYI